MTDHFARVRFPGSADDLMSGKGLRPVIRYARVSPVIRVRVDYSVEMPGTYGVTFYFDDGAQCFTRWADWRVTLDWLLARRSWSVDRVYFAHPGMIEDATDRASAAALRKRGTNVVGALAPAV